MFNQNTLIELTGILSPSGHEEKIQQYITKNVIKAKLKILL